MNRESGQNARRTRGLICENIRAMADRLCGLVDRIPGYRTEVYCVFFEVRTEFMYVM
jgi:hypothetical protein